jgi:septum formation protein
MGGGCRFPCGAGGGGLGRSGGAQVFLAGTELHRYRADVVARHDRRGQQQLVLDQLQQVELAAEHEHVVFGVRIKFGGLALVLDEQEPAVEGQWHLDAFEAALALLGHRRRAAQVQPDLRRATALRAQLALHAPFHRGGGVKRSFGVTQLEQALEAVEGVAAGKGFTGFGEGPHIQAAGVEFTRFHAAQCTGARRWNNAGMSPSLSPVPALVLASTSAYRRELLSRLRLPFDVLSPEVDETPLPGESPAVLSERLALAKARAVARQRPHAVVIGSDQVAELDGQPIGKPGHHASAVAQLRAMRGRAVVFHTAVAVLRHDTGFEAVRRVPVTVRVRALSDVEIETYLRLEQPYDCAGSAKCETLGIALLDAIESDDPTALIGLPLIVTSALLRQAGLDALAFHAGQMTAGGAA